LIALVKNGTQTKKNNQRRSSWATSQDL